MSENANLPDVKSKGLSFMPQHQREENDHVEGIANITLHPFQPMVFNVRSLSAATTRADKAQADHESYCSAPPLVLPPRPSRLRHQSRRRQAGCGDVSGGLLQRPPRSAHEDVASSRAADYVP